MLHVFADEEEEARSVVEQIEFDRQINRIPGLRRPFSFARTFSPDAGDGLAPGGRPLSPDRRPELFDRREVKDFLAYLKLMVNPHDDISLLRVANVPPRGLSDVTMERLLALSQERKISVYGAMSDAGARLGLSPKGAESAAQFVAWIERTRSNLTSGKAGLLATWADHFLDETGYFADLLRSEKDPEAGESRVRNLRDLMSTLTITRRWRPNRPCACTRFEDLTSTRNEKRTIPRRRRDADYHAQLQRPGVSTGILSVWSVASPHS